MATRSKDDRVDDITLPPPATLKHLKISPEVAWYLLTRGYDLPSTPPMIQTPNPGDAPGAMFSAERVDKVLKSFSYLRHTAGRLAGQPLTPDAWQVAYIIAPIFGWLHQDSHSEWVRVVRSAYVDVPRKNGKSTLSGGIGLYLTAADDEPGAQVLAAATTKKQAGYVFAPVKSLVHKSPALKGRLKSYTEKIIHHRTGSYFEVVASAAEALHGGNIHGAIVDELHLHKTPDLVEALETGTGSRRQPLILMITTADEGKPETIYARKRRLIEQLAKGVLKDPTTYGVVWAVPAKSKWDDPKNWAKANPGYPISPTHEYLKSATENAKNSPIQTASFKRLHLGMRTKQRTQFIRVEDWQENGRGIEVPLRSLVGRAAYGGLDLASTSDITALCWILPRFDELRYDVIWRMWTPEDNIPALNERTSGSASLWVEQEWLYTTPGNVTDYEYIERQIKADSKIFHVQSIGFDYWNATQLATRLENDGVPLVTVRQGFQTLSPVMKEMQRVVLRGVRNEGEGFYHGGNPVMAWMIDNLAVAMDPAGNVKPDKASSGEKIDGVAAMANAFSELMTDPNYEVLSEYDGVETYTSGLV